MNNKIEIKNVNKVFEHNKSEKTEVLKDINLDIKEGEFICLLGHSGCGKSTLLRIIAGLDKDYTGEALIDGRKIEGPSLDKGLVFQDHRLFPWFTVEENVGYGIPNGEDKKKRIKDMIELVGLEGFEKKYPRHLSGGMSQRVAIARALANKPSLLLLDEPFGALDALTRITMQNEILRIWQSQKNTMVMVTHDIDEAIALSSRIVILGQRGTGLKKIVKVDMSYPRIRVSQDFSNIRNTVYREFFEEKEYELEYYL
ncbi:MAG: ABC transporter ATP-binding protein [Lachnospiraceae bacterium]|nr:ABC transporter ATP-binding protein [Lachnospiraceae bacterium]MBP5565137.1 ABC transporter ATP-binding protein [Lachnospiraceae bacterium]